MNFCSRQTDGINVAKLLQREKSHLIRYKVLLLVHSLRLNLLEKKYKCKNIHRLMKSYKRVSYADCVLLPYILAPVSIFSYDWILSIHWINKQSIIWWWGGLFLQWIVDKRNIFIEKKIFIEASAHVVNVNICVANEFSL